MADGSITFKPADEKSYLLTKEQVTKTSGFGGKTIGFVGGFALLVSNLTGPGLITLSLTYQQAGWLYPTVAIIVMMVMSTLSGVFLCESMASIPGNESLQGRVEFATLARFFFGRKGHIISQIFINTALQATNVAGIVISSQVLDKMLVHMFHNTCGLQLYPHPFHWTCVHVGNNTESPFGDAIMLFTIGYLVVMAVIIPLGYLNLDDNIIIQVAALVFLVGVILDWVITFSLRIGNGLAEDVGAFTNISEQSGVLGTIMFNYAFITTIPSWVNEKKPSVSIHKSLWSACTVSSIAFFLVGYLGARAFPNMTSGTDILSVINDNEHSVPNLILVYLFPLMVLATSIPVYSIIVRYNLLQNKVVPKVWANFFAVVVPWVVAIPFMQSGALNNLMNWGSLFFASVANFIIPFVVYIKASQFRLGSRERMTDEQLEIIRSMHEDEEEIEKEEKEKEEERLRVEQEKKERSSHSSHSRDSRNSHHSSHSAHGSLSHIHTSISHVQHHHYLVHTHEEDKNINHHLEDNIPTPLPPNFKAVPLTTAQSARWIAIVSATVMVFLVIAVIVLNFVFSANSGPPSPSPSPTSYPTLYPTLAPTSTP